MECHCLLMKEHSLRRRLKGASKVLLGPNRGRFQRARGIEFGREMVGLQVDHIVPVAHGGGCEEDNLRILCGDCNLREGVKSFGLEKMRRGESCG